MEGKGVGNRVTTVKFCKLQTKAYNEHLALAVFASVLLQPLYTESPDRPRRPLFDKQFELDALEGHTAACIRDS